MATAIRKLSLLWFHRNPDSCADAILRIGVHITAAGGDGGDPASAIDRGNLWIGGFPRQLPVIFDLTLSILD